MEMEIDSMMRKEKQEKKQASRVAWRSNVRTEGKAGGRGTWG
jgi:hypothetical protein